MTNIMPPMKDGHGFYIKPYGAKPSDADKFAEYVMTGTYEKDPNGIPAGTPGAKLDAGKSPIMQGAFQYFPRALTKVADLSGLGAQKYSWKGWEKVTDGINRYGNALGRHILKEETEGMIDQDPYMKPHGVLHATQVAWNALARLELILREQEQGQKDAS